MRNPTGARCAPGPCQPPNAGARTRRLPVLAQSRASGEADPSDFERHWTSPVTQKLKDQVVGRMGPSSTSRAPSWPTVSDAVDLSEACKALLRALRGSFRTSLASASSIETNPCRDDLIVRQAGQPTSHARRHRPRPGWVAFKVAPAADVHFGIAVLSSVR